MEIVLHMWGVAANMSNKQSQATTGDGPPACELGMGLIISHCKKKLDQQTDSSCRWQEYKPDTYWESMLRKYSVKLVQVPQKFNMNSLAKASMKNKNIQLKLTNIGCIAFTVTSNFPSRKGWGFKLGPGKPSHFLLSLSKHCIIKVICITPKSSINCKKLLWQH